MTAPVPGRCQRCDNPLPDGSTERRMWCSNRCAKGAARGNPLPSPHPCENCGTDIAHPTQYNQRFCSPRCRERWHDRARQQRRGRAYPFTGARRRPGDLTQKYALNPTPRRRRECGRAAVPSPTPCRPDIITCSDCGTGMTLRQARIGSHRILANEPVCPACTKRRRPDYQRPGERYKRTVGQRPSSAVPVRPVAPRAETPPDWWHPIPATVGPIQRRLRERRRQQLWQEGVE